MSLSFNPQDIPVIGIDDHLPAVDASELRSAALRRRFLQPPPWRPEIAGEPQLVKREPARASVLVPLVERADGELTVLLTQRTDHLSDHPGQIAFPGGRAEPGDADAAATALREAREEIGLAEAHVDVLGAMPLYSTVTGFIVTPVVALVRPGFELQVDPFEVAEVFEVPLAFLMDPTHHRRHAFEFSGVQREFLSMPWLGTDSAGRPRRYFVWGATAAMLRNFYRFLTA
jgi:8-oxo-dGTP pyrophosphatase MutT (NUDIX family)